MEGEVMKNTWLSKPLCGRYVFADFKTLHLRVRDGDASKDISWRWALGLFKQGEYEILGAWSAQAAPGEVAQDLHDRGIERIGAVAGADATDLTAQYPDAANWPPAEDVSTPHIVQTFGPRRRAALRSAAATAERLQTTLSQAIRRRAPFADEASAAAFLAQQLEKADRRFWAT